MIDIEYYVIKKCYIYIYIYIYIHIYTDPTRSIMRSEIFPDSWITLLLIIIYRGYDWKSLE